MITSGRVSVVRLIPVSTWLVNLFNGNLLFERCAWNDENMVGMHVADSMEYHNQLVNEGLILSDAIRLFPDTKQTFPIFFHGRQK